MDRINWYSESIKHLVLIFGLTCPVVAVLVNLIASKNTFVPLEDSSTKSLKIILQLEPWGKSNVAIILNDPVLIVWSTTNSYFVFILLVSWTIIS